MIQVTNTTLVNTLSVKLQGSQWHAVFREALNKVRHLGLKREDVFLASYPRSGNTWVKFMLAHVLSGESQDVFVGDNTYVPYVGQHRRARCLLPSGGRVLKTHELYRRCYRKAIYLVRDVRDVATSYYYFSKRLGNEVGSPSEFVKRFGDGHLDGYGSWGSHVLSWMRNAAMRDGQILVVQYEALRQEPLRELTRIASFLNVPTDEGTLTTAIEKHTLGEMRRKEHEVEAVARVTRQSGIPVVRDGRIGGWRDFLSVSDSELLCANFSEALELLGYNERTPPAQECNGASA